MTKMYSQRVKNIPVMRFCGYSCVYCAFQKFQKLSKCEKCRAGENHSHMEVLQRTPPKTKDGEFITIGLSGDVSFMPPMDFYKILQYCNKWYDRTFLIQSKNPDYFVKIQEKSRIPDNVILATTIETNRNNEIWTIHDPLKIRIDYADISKAPAPYLRTTAMVQLKCRTAVTVEPIMDFDFGTLMYWMGRIQPEFIYIGYNSNLKLHLPEPPLSKTMEFFKQLRDMGFEVREKSLRKSWWEA